VAPALLLSLTAPPLTVWMLVRCFRVDGDCRRRSVREGWVAFELELEFAAARVLAEEEEDAGVERAMYIFEAADITLMSSVVVPEMTWLQ
jgi:NhaP-type Na+/H+ and K+/H+ antiporter